MWWMKSYPKAGFRFFDETEKIRSDLGAVAGEIAKQAALQELEVRSLTSDVGPLASSKSSYTRPLVRFEVAHTAQEDVQ